ncbi:DUF6994 family protein [Roseovarius sp. S4756]|uniref:DUF6994 family protein n=1 Tax=Roseovarius maritimus TaxID=3342637 RepID=UPI00372816F8
MIDTTFDVYSDTRPGGDPDQLSATLRRYHAMLWSKPLPDGHLFNLSVDTKGAYLHHQSEQGEFFLSSDALGHTYRYSKPVAEVIYQVPAEELDEFFTRCSTIGAYTIFPGKRVDRKPTINGARGLHPKIGDRFDLTLECIRLHYAGKASPLSAALERYHDFFDLFGSFAGYVEFFLFHDLVSNDWSSVEFFLPHKEFDRSPYPRDLSEYRTYRDAVTALVAARNARIDAENRTKS